IDATGQPIGPEFQVNDSSPQNQGGAELAVDPAGGAVVVWLSADSAGDDTSSTSIQGRRFDATGAPLASQFQVNTVTDGMQHDPAVATDAASGFVVAWNNGEYDPIIAARRYDASGVPDGDEFAVSVAPAAQAYGTAI